MLQEKGWIAPERAHLVLPFSLEPGQRHRFATERLSCVLGAYHPSQPSDPIVYEEVIRHRAWVPDAAREFSDYETDHSLQLGRFLIRFPVEASALETLHSLSPGQAARLRFRITNISQRAFGRDSELGRIVRFRLFLHESELLDEQLMFFDEQGARILLSQGFEREIPALGPGQSIDIEGTIAVAEDAPFYRAGRMWLSLELGGIDKVLEARPIQYRDFDVRVGRPFAWESPKDVLLLVHNRTQALELQAWESLFSKLGLSSGVLDLSLEGGVDLDARGSAANKTLSDDLSGRTLVVLNQAMDTSKGERLPMQFLSKEQVLGLCAGGGHVLIEGAKPPDLMRLLVPTNRSQGPVQPESEYVEARRSKKSTGPYLGEEPHRVDISKWSWLFWGKPSEKAMQRRALKLLVELQRMHPQERLMLVWELKPEQQKNYWFCKRWRMGEIQIHRTVNGAQAAISVAKVADAELHRPEHILGHEHAMHLLQALPFDEKLRRLAFLTGPGSERENIGSGLDADTLARLTSDAILVDLCHEQLGILYRGWCAGESPRSIRAGLPLLRKLLAHGFQSSKEASLRPLAGVQLIRIISRLHFFSSSQVGAWEYIPPFYFERRAPVLRGVTLKLLDEWVNKLVTGEDERKHLRQEIERARKELAAQWKRAKKSKEFLGSRSAYARELLLKPVEGKALNTSAEVLLSPYQRMLSAKAHEELCERDRKSAERRRTMMSRAVGARKRLLREESCGELVAGAQGS